MTATKISINTFPDTKPNSIKGLLTFSEQVQRGQGDGCIVAVTSIYTLLTMQTTKIYFFFNSVNHSALKGKFVF